MTPVPVQGQYERFYIKPYNPIINVSVLVPVPVPETASVIKPLLKAMVLTSHGLQAYG